MSQLVKMLEELSFRTLPALDQERYDGWVLRWSDGGSRRANSVTCVDTSIAPIPDKIRHCEEWFAARGAPSIFRLTPLADDALDGALDDLGYDRSSSTAVMSATITTSKAHREVLVAESPSDEWLRAIPAVTSEARSIDRLRTQLTSSGGRNRFASIADATGIIAIGMSLDLDNTTTIYNMNTLESERRRGHARRIFETLLARGIAAGSTRAVLQVTWDNTAAMALYQSVGFTDIYSYQYRMLGERR